MKLCYTFILLLFACSAEHSEKLSVDSTEIVKDISEVVKNISNTDSVESRIDTFSIEKGKIFFKIYPSDIWLDSIQKTMPEDDWNEVVMDNEYYHDLTR